VETERGEFHVSYGPRKNTSKRRSRLCVAVKEKVLQTVFPEPVRGIIPETRSVALYSQHSTLGEKRRLLFKRRASIFKAPTHLPHLKGQEHEMVYLQVVSCNPCRWVILDPKFVWSGMTN